ncbi:MAG: hypothetical protein HYZ50_25735 [Deltaproteobacteria bacterium]|nr:hypothetical protein [Deltaproteobacteria bacterium]
MTVALLLMGLVCPLASQAIDTAPRISDREIIESLAELKAGQQSLQQQIGDLKQSTQQQIDQLREEMNQRFKAVDQRFDAVDQRFKSVDQRFDDLIRHVDGRFDDMNRRFDDLMALMQILIGTLVLVLGGMLAWLIAIWRRLVRVEERQRAFETQDDEIKFLKEGFTRWQEMVTQLLVRLP